MESPKASSPLIPSRRDAVIQLGTAAAASALYPLFASCARPSHHNLIFILTDDHRHDAMSCAGDRFIQTPNMDRLASQGIRFTNAFVTTALCSPSRASFLTGKYVHEHGKWDNINTELSLEHKIFPQYLQGAGYKTAFIGKWHMNDEIDESRPGFDRWVSFRGQGVYENPTLNIDGERIQKEGYNTDILTDYAIDWVRDVGQEGPFCLYLSYKAVHGPFTPPERYADTYAALDIQPPATFDEDFSDKPDYFRKWRGQGKRDALAWRKGFQEFARKYYGALAAVDENVGRLMRVLDELHLDDSTTVVYAGDNGYFFGEHGGLGDKRLPYEESIRIPFFVRSPLIARPGSLNDDMVLNIDLAPTFLDIAGVPVPGEMQGQSFLPLLRGMEDGRRDSFLYEYRRVKPYDQNHPTVYGVRTREWKYCYYPEFEDEELYDLVRDPIEDANLARNPAYADVLSRMRSELERLKQETNATF